MADYWLTEEGILDRIGLLSDDVELGTFNNATKIIGTAVGVTDFQVAGGLGLNSCEWCAEHVGVVYHYGMFMPRLPKHPNCLLAGSKVRTKRGLKKIEDIEIGDKVLTHRGRFQPVTQTFKHFYAGHLYVINDIYATAEHPFLTENGWVSADCLNDVTDILTGKINRDYESLLQRLDLKPNQNPSSVTKQYLFSSIMPTLHFRVMPASSVNFNSDLSFWKSKINTVNVKSILRNNLYLAVSKNFEKLLFKIRKAGSFLISNSVSTFFRMIPISSFGCNVRGVKSFSSLFRCFARPNKFIRFVSCSQFNTCVHKANGNHALRNSKFLSNFSLIHTTVIQFDNFMHRYNFSRNHLLITTKANHVDNYKGYVYNLEVAEDHTFCVGKANLISHNCGHWYDIYRVGSPPSEETFAEWLFS